MRGPEQLKEKNTPFLKKWPRSPFFNRGGGEAFRSKGEKFPNKGHVFLCFLAPILVGGFLFFFPEHVTFGKTGSGKCAVFVFFCDFLALLAKRNLVNRGLF